MKIKRCSVEEAERIFRPTRIAFREERKRLLGSGGVIRRVSDPVYPDACCVFTPDSWRNFRKKNRKATDSDQKRPNIWRQASTVANLVASFEGQTCQMQENMASKFN